MEIIIDAELVQTLIAVAIPVIAFVISYFKKKLSNEQGDMAFSQMKMWITQLSNLTAVFPELNDIMLELTEAVEHAEALWEDPVNNSAELAQIFAHATVLYGRAMDLLAKHKVVVE